MTAATVLLFATRTCTRVTHAALQRLPQSARGPFLYLLTLQLT
jgi:hypothetical protein